MKSPDITRWLIFRRDLASLELRFPIAVLCKRMDVNKGNASAYMNGVKPISDSWLESFYKEFKTELSMAKLPNSINTPELADEDIDALYANSKPLLDKLAKRNAGSPLLAQLNADIASLNLRSPIAFIAIKTHQSLAKVASMLEGKSSLDMEFVESFYTVFEDKLLPPQGAIAQTAIMQSPTGQSVIPISNDAILYNPVQYQLDVEKAKNNFFMNLFVKLYSKKNARPEDDEDYNEEISLKLPPLEEPVAAQPVH